MQTAPAERRKQPSRRGRGESGQGRAEPLGTQPGAARSSEQELARSKQTFAAMQKLKEKSAGERGRRAEREDDEEEEEEGHGVRDRSRGDGGRREKRSRRAASEGGEGGEQSDRLRRRVHQLEKEKLELTSSHNQELCRLQAELTRLRSSVERGEAQRVELQYQLTVIQREADRALELSRDKHTLTERAAELQLKVQELQKALEITRQAREEDQHALQQEVEERDRLIQSFSSENQRLHRLLQDQEEALEVSERRIMELQKEREKEAEVNRRQAEELKYLTEREERSRREKELSDQRVKSLESSIEAERAAHLESKFNSEIVQLRVRDVEAALAVQRSGQQEAQSSLELLRAQFREVERAYNVERERSGSTERALERLQQEYEQCRSELNAAYDKERKTTSDLTESLEEEKKQHNNTHTLLEQAAQRQSDTESAFVNFVEHIRETLQQHNSTGTCPPAKDDGKLSPSAEVLQLLKTTLSACRHKLETTDKQVQDLLLASERLQEENQTLQQQTSDQSRQMEELQQMSIKLEEEVTRLRQESSDWSTQSRGLKAELEKEREERTREREGEKEGRTAEVQKIMDHYQEESKARLSFLYCLYQRLLAGCVLLDQPQSILGDFTWKELCDVINEQVDQLTSDLWGANDKIAHLQSVCEKKSVCVRELQRSQECVLSRLQESVRRREEAWSSRHTRTVTQLQDELQLCRSQCDSLRDHASSLELRLSSLNSDLSRLQGLLSRSRKETASFLSACALLAGTLKHTHRRLHSLCTQKTLLSRRLEDREELEEEVKRLAGALGGEEGEEEEERRSRAVRRWRRSVCVVLAVRRWCALANQTTVLFRVERGGGAALCVCGETTTATRRGQDEQSRGKDGEAVCTRWLRSKSLSSVILSSMADLQGALKHTDSSPVDVVSVARSALSRLLDHLLDQSDEASSLSACSSEKETLKPPQSNMKALVSSLQQHFLLFSQRLHSAEVERRSLRLEVTNLRRGLRQEREGTCRTVAAFPETAPLSDRETSKHTPLSDLSKEPPASLSTAPSQTNPAPLQQNPVPLSPLSRTPRAKRKEKKGAKKYRREKINRK
uniref:coiled-coil domain-containing protein 171 n=1 Tax=Semicossyphus pulcher TaxID=241346 RepID=UPI0037E8D01B